MPGARELPRVVFERVCPGMYRAVAASGRAYQLTEEYPRSWELTQYPNADSPYGERAPANEFAVTGVEHAEAGCNRRQ